MSSAYTVLRLWFGGLELDIYWGGAVGGDFLIFFMVHISYFFFGFRFFSLVFLIWGTRFFFRFCWSSQFQFVQVRVFSHLSSFFSIYHSLYFHIRLLGLSVSYCLRHASSHHHCHIVLCFFLSSIMRRGQVIRAYFYFLRARREGGRDGIGWDLHSLFFCLLYVSRRMFPFTLSSTQLNSTKICLPPSSHRD